MREYRTKKYPHNPTNRSQWSELRGTYIEIVRNLENNIKTGVFGYKPLLNGEV